jgi:dynein heavy chain
MGQQELPDIALTLAERNDVFRKYISNLNSTIAWYNRIRRTTKDVEFNLIESEIAEIDKLIIQGQNTLNWNSEGKLNHKKTSGPFLKIRFVGVHGEII